MGDGEQVLTLARGQLLAAATRPRILAFASGEENSTKTSDTRSSCRVVPAQNPGAARG